VILLEWSEFARRLGRELAGLERDTILIVRERDESRHYVQAMREPDRLYAEAVSNNFLEGPLLLTLADEEVMSDAGWRPPADPSPRNWWTELPESGMPGGMPSVTDLDYSRLADVMVTALRDVQGVRRPSDLVYESFHRHGNGLIELLDFGIDVADPSRVNKRRTSAATALPEANALPAAPSAAGTPMPLPEQALPGMNAELLEPRLAEAKANGDNTTYFRLLASADLVLPATASAVEDPDRAEFPTITIGSGTYITVFTSPGALARAGERHPGLYRRVSFAQLASGWPDPAWRLAINWGLPSEVLLDSSAIGRLHTGQDVTPAAGQDAPNPYGTVDPNALAGPNPVAGGAAPASNGSARGVPDGPRDDSHTAIDPYTVADLRAALEGGPPAPEAPAPSPETLAPETLATEPPASPAPEPAAAVPLSAPTDKMPDEAPDPRNAPPPEPRPAEPLPSEPLASEQLPPGLRSSGQRTPEERPAERRPAGVPMRPPHGTRLWRSAGDGDMTPLAIYDAAGGVWAPARADAVPAPWTE
jgi:hypothetical protein